MLAGGRLQVSQIWFLVFGFPLHAPNLSVFLATRPFAIRLTPPVPAARRWRRGGVRRCGFLSRWVMLVHGGPILVPLGIIGQEDVMAIVGIDLGTTNSLVAAYVDGEPVLIPNAYGEYLTPSVVSMGDDGRMLVGKLARERLVTDPKHTAARFKRLMGTDETIALGLKKYKPEELSAFVLRQLIADAEAYLAEPVTEAVISVPAYEGGWEESDYEG